MNGDFLKRCLQTKEVLLILNTLWGKNPNIKKSGSKIRCEVESCTELKKITSVSSKQVKIRLIRVCFLTRGGGGLGGKVGGGGEELGLWRKKTRSNFIGVWCLCFF